MSDAELIDLYSGRILEFAATIPLTERLSAPDATVRKRSPQCGSAVTVDVVVTDGVITGYGQDVRACALGQAAASILARHVIGLSVDEIARLRDAVRAMLAGDGAPPEAPFEDYEVLRPARAFRNRHASIMLALDATADAARTARESACG